MKSILIWTLASGALLSVASAIFIGDFLTLPLGPWVVIIWLASHRDESGVLGVFLGTTVTAIIWMIAGLFLRTIYRLFTPQPGT